jgi:hypothetical protein
VSGTLRFDPPRAPWTAALEWVVRRAFAGAADRDPEPGGALEVARSLDLSSRIGARHQDAAPGYRADHRRAVANELRLTAALDDLAPHLPSGSPLVLLKSAALRARACCAPGARPAADLDVLVAEKEIPSWVDTLRRAGFEVTGQPDYEQHGAALRAPSGGLVEIHRVLLGVRLAGRRSAAAADLATGGWLEAVADRPGVATPKPAVLLAHALVHGLVQHGNAPRGYPLTRLFADALDLGLADSDGEEMLATAAPWIAAEVSALERRAAFELCRALAAGSAGELPADAWSRRLLDHALAGALDARYRESLKVRWLAAPLSDRPVRALARHWRATLAPRPGESRGGRALDLAQRAFRALRARAAVH